jgi:hypothetical protein
MARLERATPSTVATDFLGNRPWVATAIAHFVFEVFSDLKRLLENLGFQRPLAQQSLQFPDLLLLRPVLRRRHHFLTGTVCGQSTLLR